MVHLRADVFDWPESPTIINKNFLVHAKKKIQLHIEEVIGERWDFPDGVERRSIDNGEHSSTDTSPGKICNPDSPQNLPANYVTFWPAFVSDALCSTELVNVKECKKLCINLYVFLLNSSPLNINSVTPSFHKVLGHS